MSSINFYKGDVYFMIPEIVRIPYPLCGIRFIILTDGTVYENCLYECNKILKKEEYDVNKEYKKYLLRKIKGM